MRYSSVLLGLAASAAAAPTLAKRNEYDVIEPAPLCERFSVAFTVGGATNTYVSANAVNNGTANPLLIAERLSVYPGTQAYLNYSNPHPEQGFNYAALNFVLEDGVYGAFAADLGEVYGASTKIDLVKGKQQFQWLANNGSIGHKLTAAPQSLYACNGTLNTGEENYFLSFGVYRYSPVAGYPDGCTFTKVIQNFNVEGGLRPETADGDDNNDDE